MWPIVLALILSLAIFAYGQGIEDLIDSGKYAEAYQLLLDNIDNLPDKHESLYILGTTAPTGNRSSLFLKEYLQKYPNGRYANVVRRHLLDYYSTAGLLITAGKMYPGRPDDSEISAPEDLYRIAICKQQLGEYELAEDIFRTLSAEAVGGLEAWSYLGISDCRLLSGDYNEALTGYKALVERFPDSPPVPFALIGISEAYHRMQQLEKARDFYEIYRKKYKQAPIYDEVEAALLEADMIDGKRKLPSVIDVDYYIQVGVFAQKKNAKTCIRKYRNMRLRSRMDNFLEGGKTFYRVII